MQGKGLFWWVYLLLFQSVQRTGGTAAPWAKRPLRAGWRGARGRVGRVVASCSQIPLIWGDGPSKQPVLGWERLLGKMQGADAKGPEEAAAVAAALSEASAAGSSVGTGLDCRSRSSLACLYPKD